MLPELVSPLMRWRTTLALAAVLVAHPLTAQSTDAIPYNQVQLKGSHNSEERQETLPQALFFDPSAPYQAGCRSVELDLVLPTDDLTASNNWPSAVTHDPPYDWKVATLYDDLMVLHNWHLANPGHDVITVTLDLKNAPGDDAIYLKQVETQFAETLGTNILYTPGMLQRDAATLLDGARRYGWPTLATLRDKFILVFSGAESDTAVRRRLAYLATTDPTSRLAFVDIDSRTAGTDPSKPPYTDGYRVFINIQYGQSNWCRLAVDAQSATGFVTRAWVLNDETSWNAALSAAVNLLSTDKVKSYKWAMVGNAPFRATPKPGKCP